VSLVVEASIRGDQKVKRPEKQEEEKKGSCVLTAGTVGARCRGGRRKRADSTGWWD
jgi:hypothetical protein